MSNEKKKGSAKAFQIVWTAVLSVVLVIMLLANILMLGVFQNHLDTVFGKNVINHNQVSSTDETTQAGRDLNVEIMESGAVLLENDGALPMQAGKIVMLGYTSANPVLGGSGSGSVKSDRCTTFKDAFTAAGFEIYEPVYNFYAGYNVETGDTGFTSVGNTDFSIVQPGLDEYTGDCAFDKMKEFSDTAVIILGRIGGEGNDLPTDMGNGETDADGNPKHYLELSDNEEALIAKAKETFSKVIILLNTQNAMELGFLDGASQSDPSATGDIDAALWIASIGENGAAGVAELLKGTVSPSGRLADTYAYDALSAPAIQNFGFFSYTGYDVVPDVNTGEKRVDTLAHFVNYAEGIYMGYRWYETAAVEGVIDYDAEVQYPFGYGLSYTTFSQELKSVDVDASTGVISVTASVTNTGNTAGRDVVQVYYTAPYYQGGIEKSAVNLAAYGKTSELAPGASEDVTVTFHVEDMASYDYKTEKAYVLEAGTYVISLRNNSHDVIGSQEYTVENTIVYSGDAGKRSTDQTAATNLFDSIAGDFEYMSRANHFANRPVARTADIDISSDAAMQDILANVTTIPEADDGVSAPTTGAKNGLVLSDMAGLAYDDPKWNDYLDQMTVEDMTNLIGIGGWSTTSVDSIGKMGTNDIDGPAGLSGFMAGLNACAYPTTELLASSFDPDLAEKYGETIGDECNAWGISGWYAPGANLHRTPFGGRNFEYFSEDPLVTGTCASKIQQGAKEKGIYCYMKHFVMNEQETNRCNFLCTWSNEQALRELYARPFELSVKAGNTSAIMSSFNFLGTTWSGGCSALLNDLLRGEWGFQGMVITDACVGYGYMDADVGVLNGNDLMLMFGVFPTRLAQTAAGQQAMRTSCHNILYTQANSNVVNIELGMSNWIKVLLAVDVVVALLWVCGVVFVVKRVKKAKS